jgi:hypothetical protein
MANYYGTFRSNYFKVKDAEAFKAWTKKAGCGVWENADATFGVYSDKHSEDGSIPNIQYLDPDWNSDNPPDGWTAEELKEEYREFDFVLELSTHLKPGEVAVILETGAEKLRYLHGYAVAVDHTGEYATVNLSDIYDKAFAKFGVLPSKAEY